MASVRRHRPDKPDDRDLPGDERGQVHRLAVQDFFEQPGKFIVLLARGQIAGAGVVDEKSVERDAIGAGENLRAEDVQAGGAEEPAILPNRPARSQVQTFTTL